MFLIFLGAVNETVSTFIVYNGGTNAVPLNIYCLGAALLVIWQFERWHLFSSRTFPRTTMGLFIVIWSVEVFFISGINQFCSYFIIVTSFVITLLSIFMINRLIISERRALVKNPVFIISVGFLIFFAYSFLVECLINKNTGIDQVFRVRMQRIFDVTNLFTNVLYTIAIAWIPSRLRFTLSY